MVTFLSKMCLLLKLAHGWMFVINADFNSNGNNLDVMNGIKLIYLGTLLLRLKKMLTP